MKEKQFIEKLNNLGYYDVVIEDPTIGVVSYGNSTFFISLFCPFKESEINKDSLRSVNLEIANSLYTNVIEDSILYDISTLSVKFKFKHNKTTTEYFIRHKKHDLERINKFRVVKNSDSTFLRIKTASQFEQTSNRAEVLGVKTSVKRAGNVEKGKTKKSSISGL